MLYRMSDHAASMLSLKKLQTSHIMENAIDVDVANVNLNKENISSTTVGVDGYVHSMG